MNDDVKQFLDFGAVGTAIGAFFDALPHVAALFTVIWLGLRIIESMRNLGYFHGRKTRTRKEDEADDEY